MFSLASRKRFSGCKGAEQENSKIVLSDLQITVNHSLLMNMLKTLDNLAKQTRDFALKKYISKRNKWSQGANMIAREPSHD